MKNLATIKLENEYYAIDVCEDTKYAVVSSQCTADDKLVNAVTKKISRSQANYKKAMKNIHASFIFHKVDEVSILQEEHFLIIEQCNFCGKFKGCNCND